MTTPVSPTEPTTEPDGPKTAEPAPLRAVHTPNFPALLRQLGASLLVTTYQAGKLVLVRDEGDHLNTHFRGFQAPMGMALSGDRLAVGTKIQVWEFVDVPAVTARLDPPGRHDACFLPRSSHVTGNIQIHEMAWGAGGELWVVNTRFSCLCTLDGSASFAPRWRPPFVSALEPTDRCHLNGLGMVDGRPRYVTALGETDEPAGWRENKARGGILMDVASGEVVRDGRAGGLRRNGAAGPAVPGVDQRRREIAGELVRRARRGAGRCIAGAAGAGREWACANISEFVGWVKPTDSIQRPIKRLEGGENPQGGLGGTGGIRNSYARPFLVSREPFSDSWTSCPHCCSSDLKSFPVESV
jgi:hypothetical protein